MNAKLKYMKRPSNVLPIQSKKVLLRISFDQAIKKFETEMKVQNLSDRTITFHLDNLKTFKKLLTLQDVKLEFAELTKELIKEKYILYMVLKKFKSNTINGRIKTLRKFFAFLYTEGFTSANLAKDLKMVKGNNQSIQAFSEEQIQNLLDQPDLSTFTGFRDYTIFILFYDSGIRLSELCNLRLNDVDLREGTIWVAGKGSEGSVPISLKCCKIVDRYLQYRETYKPECDNVFITLSGTPLKRKTIQDNFKKYGKKAQITNVRVSPHTIRHTFAKHYILAGGDAFSLQKILRHKSLETVKIYVNMWGGEVKKQHNKFSPLSNI